MSIVTIFLAIHATYNTMPGFKMLLKIKTILPQKVII